MCLVFRCKKHMPEGFFRRSIQKQIEYRCLRDGKCMVYRLNRNRCQYCRFKKCLAVGMSRDSVRYGRVPKRSRDRVQDESRVSSMTGESEADSELEKKQLALYDIILSVSQAHHANCPYTEDKIRNLPQRLIQFVRIFVTVQLYKMYQLPRFLLQRVLRQSFKRVRPPFQEINVTNVAKRTFNILFTTCYLSVEYI
ncbi:unnamed protein product [Soboliphyme baturini]|uniref:Nuclear receptor domain-containing protein n=1 Tax=Soboliphyme baturini TaxID=241478 RepID=A0A183J705_9BILA|nr:unnamed protein product [Soboliphyme baturini]